MRIFILFVAALGANAQLTVEIKGVTTTQAVLAYTAPDAGPCTVKVSQTSTLAPLVHDVDPVLFAGADSDARPGSITAGRARLFIAGTRRAETAADGKNYSRALQAATEHYVSVTCGAQSAAAKFTTQNIPLGMTYRDLPATVFPTVDDDLKQTIVDAHTGALMRKVNNSSGYPNQSMIPYLYFGGFVRMCGKQAVGPGPGFVCAFPTTTGGPSLIFYVIPATGESRYLGYVTLNATEGPNGWPRQFSIAYPNIGEDGSIYLLSNDNGGHMVILRGVYAGDYNAVTGDYQASIAWTNFTPHPNDLPSQVIAFDPAFHYSDYESGGWPMLSPPIGHYMLVSYRRGGQDTPGWSFAMDLSTAKIIAGINHESGAAMSYCGQHNFQVIGSQPLAALSTHGLGGGAAWQGPFVTTSTVAVDAAATTIQISGAPTDPSGRTLGGPFVGSILTFRGGTMMEPVKVTAVNGHTVTVIRNYSPNFPPWDSAANHQPHPHNAGEQLYAECTDWSYSGDIPMYWKFLEDPHGQHLGSGVMYDYGVFGIGGHTDWDASAEVTEGWSLRGGPLMNQIGQPPTADQSVSPTFSVAQGGCWGSACAMHPSYHTPGAKWFTDGLSWDGGSYTYPDPNGVTPISGHLYKYNFPYNDGNFVAGLQQLHRKLVPTLATTGGTQLMDVSGPGSVISDQPSDNYKYCHVYKAGECRPDSKAGDIFANVPALDRRTCYGSDNPDPSIRDLCVIDMPTFASSMSQIGVVANHEGIGILPGQPDPHPPSVMGSGYSRVITEALAGPKSIALLFKSLPDGSWAFFENRTSYWQYLMLVKLPPFVKDSVRRDVFVRAPIALTPPTGRGIATAEIEFGYGETGGHCTSRHEPCVAVAAAVDDTHPFSFQASDTYTRMACNPSCTITLPVLPEHVAYYQARYYDAAGALVTSGPSGVAAESAVASVNPAPITPPSMVIAERAFDVWMRSQTPETFQALIIAVAAAQAAALRTR